MKGEKKNTGLVTHTDFTSFTTSTKQRCTDTTYIFPLEFMEGACHWQPQAWVRLYGSPKHTSRGVPKSP